jgi:hypothetical protein
VLSSEILHFHPQSGANISGPRIILILSTEQFLEAECHLERWQEGRQDLLGTSSEGSS